VSGRRLHLATGTNAAYLHWCATTVLSALRSTPDADTTVHVIVDDDVTASDRARMARMVEGEGATVDWVGVDHARLAELPDQVREHGGAISCARFLLPDQLADVDRLVYVDADTLVVSSLLSLADTDLGGAGLGAVHNVVEPRMRWHLDQLPLADPGRYLNSGVLVMDLGWMRAHGTSRELLDCVRRQADTLLWVDQDALNLVFAGAWAELHPRWNAQNSLWRWPELAGEVFGPVVLRETLTDPAVLHFEGPSLAKPWHYLCTHPFRERYRAMAAQTPWGPVPLADRTPATALIARAPAGWRLPLYVRLLAARRRFTRQP